MSPLNVCFGPLADIPQCGSHVRLPPKAPRQLPFQLIESVDRKIALLKSAYQFAPKCDRGLSLDQITLVENSHGV